MIEQIDAATRLNLAKGIRVAQTHFFDADPAHHVALLLEWLQPPTGAHIVDAGAGLGEVARIMQAMRPDLTFTLVNISAFQLSHAPAGTPFRPVLADFCHSGLPDQCADIVMFNSALCQMPMASALTEARRLLKPDGHLFLNELALPQTTDLQRELHATFPSAADWQKLLVRYGFAAAAEIETPPCNMAHFRDCFEDPAFFDQHFAAARPFVVRAAKAERSGSLAEIMGRHEKIALQFSGGRDSMASLYLLQPYWDRLTVYWMNPGNPFPETAELMAAVRDEVPNFVEITGQQPENIRQFGIPSDIVPVNSTPIGIMGEGGARPLIQDRYSCCWRNLMAPMQARMQEDGVSLIIRGQRNADRLKSPLRSGALIEGIEYLFPIEAWSDAEVMSYLTALDAPIPPFYAMLDKTPDCLDCSAWWEDGVSRYLKAYHPDAYAEVQSRLNTISAAVGAHILHFNKEVNT